MSTLERKLAAREKIIQNLRHTIAGLAGDENASISEIPLPKTSQGQFQRIIQQLETELEDRTAQLSEFEDSLRDIRAENRLLGRLNEDLRSERTSLLDQVGEMESSLADSTELKRAIEQLTAENASLQKKLQHKHEFTSRLEARLRILEQQNKSMKDVLEVGGADAITSATIFEKLEHEKTARLAVEEKYAQLVAESRSLKVDHDSIRLSESSRDQRVSDLNHQVALLHERLAEANARQSMATSTIETLKHERMDLEQRISELQHEYSGSLSRCSAVTKTNVRLSADLGKANEKIRLLEGAYDKVKLKLRLEMARPCPRPREHTHSKYGQSNVTGNASNCNLHHLQESDYQLLETLRHGVQQLRDELEAEYENSEYLKHRLAEYEEKLAQETLYTRDMCDRLSASEQALYTASRRVQMLEKHRIDDLVSIQRLEDSHHSRLNS